MTPRGSPGISSLAFNTPFSPKPLMKFDFYYERSIQPYVLRVIPSSGKPGLPTAADAFIQVLLLRLFLYILIISLLLVCNIKPILPPMIFLFPGFFTVE